MLFGGRNWNMYLVALMSSEFRTLISCLCGLISEHVALCAADSPALQALQKPPGLRMRHLNRPFEGSVWPRGSKWVSILEPSTTSQARTERLDGLLYINQCIQRGRAPSRLCHDRTNCTSSEWWTANKSCHGTGKAADNKTGKQTGWHWTWR